MSLTKRSWLSAALLMAGIGIATPGRACTIATSEVDLGSEPSYTVGTTAQTGSGMAGLSCDVTLAALTAHYVGLIIESSTFRMAGPGGSLIEYEVATTSGGAALGVGSFQNLSSISVVSLFSGAGGALPLYFRTKPKTALPAGDYTGTINLRWHYSVCALGVLACLSISQSPGFVRPIPLVQSLNWGSGTAVTVTVKLTVENDCRIDAPALQFGSAPIVTAFSAQTRTIKIRCSAGSSYDVGLNNGNNGADGLRRMKSGNNLLRYEIYKSGSSSERWGATGGERRPSSGADTMAGTYDSITEQTFTYRAEIEPTQNTPLAGNYSDTVAIDVAF